MWLSPYVIFICSKQCKLHLRIPKAWLMDYKSSVKCLHVPQRSGSLVMVSLEWPSWLPTLHSPSNSSGRAPVLERLMIGAAQNSVHPAAMASRGRQNSELPKFDPKCSSHPSCCSAWQDSSVKTVWGTPQSLSPSFEWWEAPRLMFSLKAWGAAEGQSHHSMCPRLQTHVLVKICCVLLLAFCVCKIIPYAGIGKNILILIFF